MINQWENVCCAAPKLRGRGKGNFWHFRDSGTQGRSSTGNSSPPWQFWQYSHIRRLVRFFPPDDTRTIHKNGTIFRYLHSTPSNSVLRYSLQRFTMSKTLVSTQGMLPNPQHQGVPFSSRRSVVHSINGMIACTQPLAAEAGHRILRQGGNAAVSDRQSF